MPATLDPLIVQKLEAFGRRWRRLVLARGGASAVFTLLAGMMLVAVADFLVLMPDGLRLALSLACYVATLAVFWRTCGRALLRLPGPRELARLVEKAEPQLREDLLSAVELGQLSAAGEWDSPVFRALLQENVAGRLRNIRIESLLPRRLIAFWLRAAAVVVVVCGALFLVPGLHYDRLIVRAFAPLVDVERVSRVKITVLEPGSADRWQPQGDTLSVVVEISGPEPSKVILETFSKTGERSRLAMNPAGARRYSAGVTLGADALQFRVRAGDGLTRRFSVETRPRPGVVKFEKTYQFPAYSRRAPRTATEDHGDLIALEGSEVKLALAANQPLQRASLEVEIKGKTNFIALTVNSTRAEGVVPLKFAGAYRAQLVAAETGFENKFSPQYELRPVPDLVPRVTIDQPRQDLVVPPEEVVQLQATASDDVGLARVFQTVLVNEEPFGDFTLSEENKTNLIVTRAWDLLQLKAAPGDRVTTKLTAVDLKGGRAESAPLHLVIGSSGLNTRRLLALEARRALHESLVAARDAVQKTRTTLAQDSAGRNNKGGELQAKQLLTGALTGLGEVAQTLDKSWDRLKETLPHARPGRESAELARLGGLLAQARRVTLPDARAQLDAALKETAANAAQTLRLAQRSPQQLAGLLTTIEAACADLFAAEEGDVIVENLAQLAREQERINQQAVAETSPNANTWQRLARRQGGAVGEMQIVEGLLKDLKSRVPRSLGDRASKPFDNLQRSRAEMEKALTAGDFTIELLGTALRLQKSTALAATDARVLNRDLAVRADKARDTLHKLAPTSAFTVERVRRHLDEAVKAKNSLADVRRRGQHAKAETQLKAAQDGAAEDWRTALDQLKDRAEVEEFRRDTEPQFVADLGHAAQSLAALRAVAGAPISTNALAPVRGMEKSLRVIEAGRGLGELVRGALHFAQQEQWENQSGIALTSQPKDWSWMDGRMKMVPGDVKKAGLPDRVAGLVSAVPRSPAAQAIASEMSRRLGPAPVSRPVPAQAEKVYNDLLQALRELEPLLAEARQAIGAAAPKLSDMMAGLARSAEELQKKSSDAVKPDKEAGKVPDEAKELLSKQQALNLQVEELREAIRREANARDLAQGDNRERVRDADDAIALLRDPPPKAEDALREATQAHEYLFQRTALTEAAAQQGKLAGALNQLAEHYKNLEAGQQAADTRQALRRAEEELGIKSMLDEQFALAEKLNELAKQSPEAMLRQLEQELGQNQAMRQELSNIAKDALGQARNTLTKSARREQELARKIAAGEDDLEFIERDPLFAEMDVAFAERALQIAKAARELAEKDAPAIAEAAGRARADTAVDTDAAQKALQAVADKMPGDFKKPSPEVAQQVGDLAGQLQLAESGFKSAASKSERAKSAATEEVQTQAAETAQAAATRAAERSGELSKQAQELADDLNAAATAAAAAKSGENPKPPVPVVPDRLVEAAKQLAAQARELGNKTAAEINREAAKARLDVSREVSRALRATREVAAKAQTAGNKSPYEMVREVAGFVEPLREASKEFRLAAEKGEQLAKEAIDGDIERAAESVNDKSAKAADLTAKLAQMAKDIADALSGNGPAAQATAGKAGDKSPGKAGTAPGANPPGASGEMPVSPEARDQAAGQQPEIAANVSQAGGDIERAGRHETRLGTEQGNALQAVGQKAQAVGAQTIPETQAVLEKAGTRGAAQAALDGARAAIEEQVSALDAAMKLPGASAGGQQGASAASPEQAKWMARALDRLDSEMNSKPGGGSGQPGGGEKKPQDSPSQAGQDQGGKPDSGQNGKPSSSSSSMQSAADAQRSSMAAARSQGKTPGDKPQSEKAGEGSGAAIAGGPEALGLLPQLRAMRAGEWGKLPPKLAQGLAEAQREGVAGEYRTQVEAYFRAVAEKAKDKAR